MDLRTRALVVGLLSVSGCATAQGFDASPGGDGGALDGAPGTSSRGGSPSGTTPDGSGGRDGISGADGTGAFGTTPEGAGGTTGGGVDPPSSTGGTTTSGGAGTASSGGALPDGGGTTSAGGAPTTVPTGTLTRKTTGGGRSYLVYVPASVDPSVPVPLLFVHHGYNGSADQIRTLTHFDVIAEERRFIAVFPEGVGATWNAGLLVCGFGQFVTGFSDDFGFEQEMLTTISQSVTIDRSRVFVTGFSMGGYFSNNIGCMRPDLVKGIAPHSGGGPPAGCAASRMPAFIVHGTADPLIFYDCGVQAREFWVAHNGCSTAVDTVAVKGGSCEWSRGCPDGGQVVFCHMDGMVHGWAGATGKDGGGTQYENASRLIWDFFEKQ